MKFLLAFWTRYRAPLALFLLAAFCLITFRQILMPFMVAIFVAYVIDPVVAWMSSKTIRGRNVPRGAAVVSVYTVVLALVTAFLVLVAPQLGREVGGLARDVPTMIQDVRQNHLPALNERLNRFVMRSPSTSVATERASALIHEQLFLAEEQTFVLASLTSYGERARFLAGELTVRSQDDARVPDRSLVRLHQEDDGDWMVLLAHDDIRIQPQDDGSYRIRVPSSVDELPKKTSAFDLVRVLDDALENFAEASGRKLTDVVSLGQRLVSKLTGAMLSTLVTFMVAAFISIDVPRIIQFFRSLFPAREQEAFSSLLRDLNRGLSGVIRGQLVICLVNGFLTWIGLFFLGVKFSFVLAVIAGTLSLIPVFGTIISTVPCVLIGLTQSVTTGLLVLGWILFIHFVEGNILNPKIIGSSARIHPALIVFALIAGEHSYGILGALLAVPIASIIQTLFLFFLHDRWRESAVEESELAVEAQPVDA